jgi:hypothetical protein
MAARKPLRWIQDPNASFSNVIVDRVRDEVVLLDANRFEVLVYNRLDNTSSSQQRTEPKRRIGGPKTLSQFASDIYVDPANSDIYAINNDSLRGMNVFSTRAAGDVKPDRHFDAPYGSFGIAVDEKMQELFVTYNEIHDEIVVDSNIGQAIVTYRGGANGDEAPIRYIQGPKTGLIDPVSVAIDQIHDEIFAFQRGPASRSVLVFDRTAQGDVAPKRVLNVNAGHGAVDPVNNLLILPGRGGLQIFDRTAQGDAQPKATIGGPKSGLRGARAIEIYPPTRKIVVNAGGGGEDSVGGDYVGVWSLDANGDVPPEWTVGKGILKQMRGLTLDPANKTVIVSDKYYNGVLTFALPEMFTAVAAQRTRLAVDIQPFGPSRP